jgi:hypothetical protein
MTSIHKQLDRDRIVLYLLSAMFQVAGRNKAETGQKVKQSYFIHHISSTSFWNVFQCLWSNFQFHVQSVFFSFFLSTSCTSFCNWSLFPLGIIRWCTHPFRHQIHKLHQSTKNRPNYDIKHYITELKYVVVLTMLEQGPAGGAEVVSSPSHKLHVFLQLVIVSSWNGPLVHSPFAALLCREQGAGSREQGAGSREPFPDVLCRGAVLGASLLSLVVPKVFGFLLAAVVNVCLALASWSVPVVVDNATRILLVALGPEVKFYVFPVVLVAVRVCTDFSPSAEVAVASVEGHV